MSSDNNHCQYIDTAVATSSALSSSMADSRSPPFQQPASHIVDPQQPQFHMPKQVNNRFPAPPQNQQQKQQQQQHLTIKEECPSVDDRPPTDDNEPEDYHPSIVVHQYESSADQHLPSARVLQVKQPQHQQQQQQLLSPAVDRLQSSPQYHRPPPSHQQQFAHDQSTSAPSTSVGGGAAAANNRNVYGRLSYNDDVLYISDHCVEIGRNSSTSSVHFHVGRNSFVSRKHLQMIHDADAGEFYLNCLSKNGIFVNDVFQRKSSEPLKLTSS